MSNRSHGHALAGSNLVVHDVGHHALLRPSALVLAHSVLEVENGITLLRRCFILGGGVDEAATLGILQIGVVLALAHLSVRNVLVKRIVGGSLL